jgi:hypothetical protein
MSATQQIINPILSAGRINYTGFATQLRVFNRKFAIGLVGVDLRLFGQQP